MEENKERRTGLQRLIAIWEFINSYLEQKKYEEVKTASKQPLDPGFMNERFGQPTADIDL